MITTPPADAPPATCRVAALVTAYRRDRELLATLQLLAACRPAPSALLVHVDGGEASLAEAVRAACPAASVIVSDRHVGPGGGRNRLIAAATSPFVATFDDDSHPIDPDYFARVERLFAAHPDASVVTAAVYHRGEPAQPDTFTASWTADFSGGACAYRREHFLETGGYVPLATAYGMEEVDLAIRLRAAGRRVLYSPWLRVRHDSDLAHHADPDVNARTVVNLALLVYLRYPVSMWPVGAAQWARRVWWLITHGRRRGVLHGVVQIPGTLRAHVHSRLRVSAAVLRDYLRLRRRPQPALPVEGRV